MYLNKGDKITIVQSDGSKTKGTIYSIHGFAHRTKELIISLDNGTKIVRRLRCSKTTKTK